MSECIGGGRWYILDGIGRFFLRAEESDLIREEGYEVSEDEYEEAFLRGLSPKGGPHPGPDKRDA